MVAQLDGRWGEAFRFAPGQVKLRFLDCASSDHGDEDTKADRPRESRYVQEEQDTHALLICSRHAALFSWLVLLLNRSAGSAVCSSAGS